MNDLINLFNQAISCHQSGRISEAINLYMRILPMQRDNEELLFTIGTAYCQIGQHEEGLNYLRKSSRINPKNFHAFGNMGKLLTDLRRFDEAIINYKKALVLNPKFPEALLGLANALVEIQKHEEALENYNQALELVPNFAIAHLNKGKALFELQRFNEALDSYDRAIALAPDLAEGYSNRGNVYKELERHEQALLDYTKAIQVNPNLEGAYSNRGCILEKLKRYDEALVDHDKAIALKPDYAEAYSNRGTVLQQLKRYDEALASYDKAITLKSDIDYLYGTILHTKMQLCDWESFDDDLTLLKEKIKSPEKASLPFIVQGLLDSPGLQKNCAETYITDKYPDKSSQIFFGSCGDQKKIKIGYYSSDFGNHPVTHLLAGLFEEHDHVNFEIIAFSLERRDPDEWRNRVINSVDQFIEVHDKSDSEIAELSRSLGIDIAVDLNGHTKGGRTGVFAHRLAPVQTSYIGFLGTMGANYFDYLISDPVLIPQESRNFYSEKIVYLPFYQCNDDKLEISNKVFTRSDFGLSDSQFVFCSFNNNYKITPPVFDSWMKIMGEASNSVLWVYVENETAKLNLQKAAEARGVNPNRLVFANKIPLKEHLARQRLADLFLDTYPYNAGATASNALRVGLPLITRAGNSFASRYGASLLNAVGLPELVTYSAEAFESLAVELAIQPNRLALAKNKLATNLSTYPLFDTSCFVKNLESAFVEIHKRRIGNVRSDHIYIGSN